MDKDGAEPNETKPIVMCKRVQNTFIMLFVYTLRGIYHFECVYLTFYGRHFSSAHNESRHWANCMQILPCVMRMCMNTLRAVDFDLVPLPTQ